MATDRTVAIEGDLFRKLFLLALVGAISAAFVATIQGFVMALLLAALASGRGTCTATRSSSWPRAVCRLPMRNAGRGSRRRPRALASSTSAAIARSGGTPSAAQESAALAAAIQDAFVVAAAVCAIGIATSLIRGGGRRVTREPA